MVIAGDLAFSGPHPLESISVVRDLNVPTIYGNNDQALYNHASFEEVTTAPRDHLEWTRKQIGEEGMNYLANLPFEYRITPPGKEAPVEDLLIVHATPTDVSAVVVVEPDGIFPMTPENRAKQLLGSANANLIVAGHIHHATYGMIGNQRFATVGSVGLPID